MMVTVLDNHYNKETHMHILCTLFFIEAKLQFKLISQHIPCQCNTLADHFSRNQLEKFYTDFPTAHQFSFVVSSSLPQWFLDPNMDWTSPRWTRLFTIFVHRV